MLIAFAAKSQLIMNSTLHRLLVCVLLFSLSNCEKENYSDIYPEYVGVWRAYPFFDSPYGYEVILTIEEDGTCSWTKQELGTDKISERKGRFKVQDDLTLFVGRKKFNITQVPSYNQFWNYWEMELDSIPYSRKN